YVVEVRLWVKQVRPSGESEEYEMTIKEARKLKKRLIGQDVKRADIRVKEA
ncbi:unnamed protein product, partial [marine sediment metagenome]